MAFDWFRRRFSQQQESSQPEETEQQPPESEQPSAAVAAPTTPAQDYLDWAKAAYQNIQKRQQAGEAAPSAEPATTEVAPPAIAEPPEPPAPPTEATEPAAIAPVAESIAPAPSEPEVVAPEPAVETEVPPIVAVSEVAPEPAPAPTPAPASEPAIAEPAAPLPFWAQSDAERQARLERLKETAIVEPEPVAPAAIASAAAAPAVTELTELPEMVFDEGFLWSAEVLAAQGRRADQISIEEITWLKRLRQGLDKTRRGLINQLRAIVGQGPLNEAAVMEIEAALLQADVGVEATDAIIALLQQKVRDEVLPPDAAISYLKQILRDMLDAPLERVQNHYFAPEKDKLNIWLITGVNGAGKTTTIGKLAHIAQKSGYECLIAAADTFRAAAVEQVKIWGSRSGVDVIANPGKNTDPAAVVFDAIAAAKARHTELLLVDTAGRLQNKKNLMDELSKVRRIIDKKADHAVVESLLVLDATLGQNGLRQAEVFSQAAQLSGVVLTKLDGTAKGGIALAVVQQLGLPIRFIGAGEGIEDLRPFSSYEFVEALLNG
jgi:fused signal recognition particle receptor